MDNNEVKDDYSYWSENLHSSYLFYTMEVDKLNKLNKQLTQKLEKVREALEKIVLIYPKYNRCINNNWKGNGDGSMCKHCNTNDICPHLIAKQALKGVE